MIWKRPRIAFEENNPEAGGGGKPPAPSPAAPAASDTVTLSAAELDTLRASAAKAAQLEHVAADAKAKADADLKAKQDAAAIKAGETKTLLEKKNAEIAELKEFQSNRLEVDKNRIDGKVAKLPAEMKLELDLVRDAFGDNLPKLEEWVDMRSKDIEPAPPAPGVPRNGQNGQLKEPLLDREGKFMLRKAGANQATKKFAEQVTSRGPVDDPDFTAKRVFRLDGVKDPEMPDDERNGIDTDTWIETLQTWSPRPYDLKMIEILDAQKKAAATD